MGWDLDLYCISMTYASCVVCVCCLCVYLCVVLNVLCCVCVVDMFCYIIMLCTGAKLAGNLGVSHPQSRGIAGGVRECHTPQSLVISLVNLDSKTFINK